MYISTVLDLNLYTFFSVLLCYVLRLEKKIRIFFDFFDEISSFARILLLLFITRVNERWGEFE